MYSKINLYMIIIVKIITLIVITSFIIVPSVYSQTAEDYAESGESKLELKDYKGAILDFNKAIELAPNNANVYYNRGLAKISLGQKDSGCLDLSKAGEMGYSEAYDYIKEFCN